MNTTQWSYVVFAVVLVTAILFDLGLVSKRSKTVTMKQAFYQTIFWIILAMAFFIFIWVEKGQKTGLEYLSAYLMEWSLSIDNIFVFILIFSFFGIHKEYYGRVLLIGILMAIIFRIIFITIGIALVSAFAWVLYIFGAFLIYTGIKMFFVEQDDEFHPSKNKVYVLLKKIFPITDEDAGGKFTKK